MLVRQDSDPYPSYARLLEDGLREVRQGYVALSHSIESVDKRLTDLRVDVETVKGDVKAIHVALNNLVQRLDSHSVIGDRLTKHVLSAAATIIAVVSLAIAYFK